MNSLTGLGTVFLLGGMALHNIGLSLFGIGIMVFGIYRNQRKTAGSNPS